MRTEKMGFLFFRKRSAAALAGALAAAMLLTGCVPAAAGQDGDHGQITAERYTVPPDGNPGDISCRGNYIREFFPDAIAARAGEEVLTNGELNVLYHLIVNGYEPEEGMPAPDYTVPLEAQEAPGTGITWQQYFLHQALDTWYTLEALEQKSREYVERNDEYFDPSPRNHEKYMSDMPINDILYTKDGSFKLGKMHREYLDRLPGLLSEKAKELGYADAEAMVQAEFGDHARLDTVLKALERANLAYMYFTDLTYDIQPGAEELEAPPAVTGEKTVDIRQVLLIPENGKIAADGTVTAEEVEWDACEARAQGLHQKWEKNWKRGENTFAAIAHEQSADAGSAVNGGLYANVEKGQLPRPLEDWCFAPEREPGDIEKIRTDYGWHLVYFCGGRDQGETQALAQLRKDRESALVESARESYPVEVEYDQITLDSCSQPGKLRFAEDLLYPDVAHERISEIPVYIQQDFANAPYGGYRVGTHGCGITTLAMLATYMSDTYLTPAVLAERYGRYNGLHGTDGMIFNEVPPDMGFYFLYKTHDWEEAKNAMREGRKVVSVQHKGYFTRGGHYLALSEITDDDMIIIRDSNLYNYGRLREHKQDRFPASLIPRASHGYWVFDYKILSIPACTRCGDPEHTGAPELIHGGYLCPKCRTALERRDNFLELSGLN